MSDSAQKVLCLVNFAYPVRDINLPYLFSRSASKSCLAYHPGKHKTVACLKRHHPHLVGIAWKL